jgi:ADP-ribose pyrophosphatase YjhB (NUDIX family)
MNNCELCSFNNPKATVTAIAIRDNKVLLLKRNEEPFKGMWDFVGGYMQADELPEEALRREIKEELGVDATLTYIKPMYGSAVWKDEAYPILSHFYLVELIGDITLNDENSDYCWMPLDKLEPSEIAFDSNMMMAKELKLKFAFDLVRVNELLKQLDSSANLNEYDLYKSILCGYMARIYDGELLIGMGWIYPRQTTLRHQAVVEDMIVDEKYRGKGYGDKLLIALLDWAKTQGVEVVELTSGYHRVAAHALYKRHDFQIHETAHMLKKL